MHVARVLCRLFPLAAALLLLPAGPAVAGKCCAATDTLLPEAHARRLALSAMFDAPWMFMNPVTGHLPKRSGSRQFDYMFEHHFWLTGGVQVLPTGLLFTPETSAADRSSFSQARIGVGYMLSAKLRAISNWNAGLGRYNVSPGNQFTVGIAVRY